MFPPGEFLPPVSQVSPRLVSTIKEDERLRSGTRTLGPSSPCRRVQLFFKSRKSGAPHAAVDALSDSYAAAHRHEDRRAYHLRAPCPRPALALADGDRALES